jgi:hypothetical protein
VGLRRRLRARIARASVEFRLVAGIQETSLTHSPTDLQPTKACPWPSIFADVDVLAKGVSSPTLIPLGIVRMNSPDELATVSQCSAAWILPEINRRIGNGSSRESLVLVRAALISFPPPTTPERFRVLLNAEVQFGDAIQPTYSSSLNAISVGKEVTVSLRNMFNMRRRAKEERNWKILRE